MWPAKLSRRPKTRFGSAKGLQDSRVLAHTLERGGGGVAQEGTKEEESEPEHHGNRQNQEEGQYSRHTRVPLCLSLLGPEALQDRLDFIVDLRG